MPASPSELGKYFEVLGDQFQFCVGKIDKGKENLKS
jgi:hypothetical protein